MGDILQWVFEQKTCDIRISQLDSSLRRWEAEETELRRFRAAACETWGELEEKNGISLEAAADMESMAETCRSAGLCGSGTGGAVSRVGRGLGERALADMMERIDRELALYDEKMDTARNDLRHARARREQLEQMIRGDQEE